MIRLRGKEHLPFLFFVGSFGLALNALAIDTNTLGPSNDDQGRIVYEHTAALESFNESAFGDFYPQQMTPEALEAFRQMQAAAAADGIRIHSQVAFRSYEEQERLFNDAVERYGSYEEASKWVVPPGHSEHHTGNAVDLRGSSGGLLQSTGSDRPTYEWLLANASAYGFILSYPEGNDRGVGFEPWHWLFTGVRSQSEKVADESQTENDPGGSQAPEGAEKYFEALLGAVADELASSLPIDYFVKMDIPFGMSDPKYEEHGIDNTASGNWKKRSIPCPKKEKCAHIEVWRPSRSQSRIRWISGKHQKVSGGWGAGKAICSKEPTGRYPFGTSLIKLVLTDVREAEGKANFALYFAQEIFGPFGIKIGETAACFGPFPIPPPYNEVGEEEWALFGLDKVGVDPFGIAGRILRKTIKGGGGNRTSQPSEAEILANAEDCDGSEGTYIKPTTGQFTSGYGDRWGRMHWGVDIANAIGTPIYAANCGVVDFIDYQSGFGNILTIKHPSGAGTLYAHLNEAPLVNRGTPVKRGQIIGYMGSTGRSTGPHLHFEIHPGGYINNESARDPTYYVNFF